MRLSVILLCAALAGILGGAWLCGPLAFGIAVMADSVAIGVFALLRESEDRPGATVQDLRSAHAEVLERARRAP